MICRSCGADITDDLLHDLRCDGQQGAVEALLPDPAVVNRDRDAAMQSVADHAEAVCPDFGTTATAFVVRYLALHGPTSGEVLTVACKRAGIRPHDDRAFGPVYAGLVRGGRIERCGMVRRERGHGTAGGTVWGLRTPGR